MKYYIFNKPKTLINFVYDYAGVAPSESGNKYAVVARNNKYYLADFNEEIVSSGFNNMIVDYNDTFVVTKSQDNVYKIYNLEGSELTPGNYLFIKIIGDYYALLLDNGLVVYDKNGIKYNETPIGLTSTNYNRTYIFDANKQLISNEVAFEIEVNEEYISVTRGKANDLLSIKDALANKDRPFISYFNGILYFYADNAKKENIGKYTCKNRNSVEVMDHCTMATSSNISSNDVTYDIQTGVIAILNNRFVFINDTPTSLTSNPNIYLYDLSLNKKLGPYTMVETTGLISLNYDSKTADGSYVIAKNTKDQFGLLKINSSSVDIVLNFEYGALEKSGDNFIARKSSGKYVLINKEGKEISKEIPDKIMSYNEKYIAAKGAMGYKLYDFEGKEIDNKSYSYIKLDKKYYVAIVSNSQLEIHEYEKVNEPINFGKKIAIKSSDSWRSVNYFKVENLGNLYKVTITDGENNNVYESITEANNNDNNLNNQEQNNNMNNEGDNN